MRELAPEPKLSIAAAFPILTAEQPRGAASATVGESGSREQNMKRLFSNHPRLWISCAAGLLVFLVLPRGWPSITRLLCAWNCGVVLFLGLLYLWMSRLTAQQICLRFSEEDESAPVVLVMVTAAALLSLVAIVALLATIKQVAGPMRAGHMLLGALTVVDSWLLVPTIFTSQYADMFYRSEPQARPLTFPNTPMPVFWDFAYFSFTIAAACQTSDVSTMQQSIRKLVLAHTLISFVFNASILGFAVNISAGLFGAA